MSNKKNKVDIEKMDLDKDREKTSENPGLLPYASSVGGVVIKPDDKGKIKGRAMAAMVEQTDKQMTQLYRQMEVLAAQAKEIKARVAISERIYQTQINFEPLIGHIYYLYEREGGTDLLSIIAPDEWGRSKPFKSFLAEVKLLADHTWEVNHKQPGFD